MVEKNNIKKQTPDWSVITPKQVAIQIFKKSKNEFNSGILLYIDNDKQSKMYTIYTDIIDNDLKECIIITAQRLALLYSHISAYVMVVDESLKIIQEYDLNELFTEYKNKYNITSQQRLH